MVKQLALVLESADRVHGFGFPLNALELSLTKVTVPVGVLGVPKSVSVTVAVHVGCCAPHAGVGSHLTEVCVERR